MNNLSRRFDAARRHGLAAGPFRLVAVRFGADCCGQHRPDHRAVPARGTVDPLARMVQPGLQLGSTSPSSSRQAGASGSLGAAQVAKSPPDGSNWLFVFDTHAVNPFLQNLPFDTEKDLEPASDRHGADRAGDPSGPPVQTFADVIAAAKAKPEDRHGSIGNGSLGHLTMVLLGQRAGVKMVHVPYRGGGPLMNDALAGHVDLAIGSAALVRRRSTAASCAASRKPARRASPACPACRPRSRAASRLRVLCVWGSFTAGKTPRPLSSASARRWRNAERALRSRSRVEAMQITLSLGGPDVQRKFLADQMKLWGPVVKEHNIKADS